MTGKQGASFRNKRICSTAPIHFGFAFRGHDSSTIGFADLYFWARQVDPRPAPNAPTLPIDARAPNGHHLVRFSIPGCLAKPLKCFRTFIALALAFIYRVSFGRMRRHISNHDFKKHRASHFKSPADESPAADECGSAQVIAASPCDVARAGE